MAANQVPRVQDANHALIYMQAVTTIMVSLGHLSKTTSYSRFLLDTSMKYASAIMLSSDWSSIYKFKCSNIYLDLFCTSHYGIGQSRSFICIRWNANPPDFVTIPNASDRTFPQNTFSYNYASSGFGLMPLYYPVDA